MTPNKLTTIVICGSMLGMFQVLADTEHCGNNDPCGTAGPCECGDTDGKAGVNSFRTYTANAFRAITDLEVWGGVGEHRLAWTRHANSRYDETAQLFGHGQNWRHSYQWQMADAGTDGQGRALLEVHYPDGKNTTFTKVDATHWNPYLKITDRITQSGTTYTMQRGNGWRYTFVRLENGSYQMQNFADSQGNVYTFTYDTNGKLVRVTEPAGRYIEITYQDILCNDVEFVTFAWVNGTPPAGWSQINVTDTTPYRYLRYVGPDGSYSTVAEIEFYDVNTHKLSGAAFGTSPAWSGREYWKATDGLTNTWFSNYDKNHGFTGIDLGSGNATRISKVRFFPLTGYESRMNGGWFQGSLQPPVIVSVIASVQTSDGRSVTYDYQTLTDPNVPGASYAILTAANYGDGTQAVYTYAQTIGGTQPSLITASDPRYQGSGSRIKYEYRNTRGRGLIWKERDLVSNTELVRLDPIDDNNLKVTTANGAIEKFYQPSGNYGHVVKRTDALNRETNYSYGQGSGLLKSKTDARGAVTAYNYSIYGSLLSRTNADNSAESWTRDSLDLPLTHTDELGRVTTYTRDPVTHRVMRVDYADGTNEQFTYNNWGQILTHILRNGGVEQFSYDPQGRKTSQSDPLGNVTAYGYVDTVTGATNDLPLVVVDARGNSTQYEYNERGQTTKITNADGSFRTVQYDALGNKSAEIDELSRMAQWRYDSFQRVTTNINALGYTTIYSYDLPGGGCGCAHTESKPTKITLPSGKMTTFSYDLAWQKLSETVAFGTADAGTTQYQYDPNGNLLATIDPLGRTWSQTYDDRNRRATARDPLGNTTQWGYDAIGNRTVQIDANGKYTYWTYDTVNRVTAQIRKEGDTNQQSDASDAVTRYTYDAMGNVLTITDPNGNATTHQYNLASRRTRTTNAANEINQFFYDAVGNLTTNIAPNGNVTVSLYDERNRLTQVQDSVGFIGSTSYDAKGNRLTQTDGNGNTTSFGYDAADQLVTVTDPLNHSGVNQYDVDGNLIRVTDRNNRVTQYGYDNRNRRVTVTDALSNVTRTTYDANNNVISVTDANDHVTSYGYDAANRKLTETYPDAAPNTVSFTYDGVGNVLTKTDQKGQVTTFAYNDLYYLLSRSVPGFPADVYTYDAGGRMLTATRNGWQVTFAYDPINRVIQTSSGTGVPPVGVVSYTYNAVTGTRTVTYPSGRAITEQMDLRGRLGTVQDAAGVIASYTYDLGNRVGTRSFPNGVVATYGYNANNWITGLDHSGTGVPPVASFRYAYDNEGNKLYEEKLHQPGNSEAYGYDAINRLTDYRIGTLVGATVPTPLTQTGYNLDSVGNWNSKVKDGVTENRTHNNANEITAINGNGIVSDNNGNITQDLQNQYQYDEGNRLVSVFSLQSSVFSQYCYDALGRRISKTTAAGTTVFYYDAARIIEERVGGATSATYVYGNYVDEVLAKDTPSQRFYYHQNALWSVHALTDADGNVVERYSYDAYGQLSVLDPNYQLLTTAPLAYFTYTGREYDFESGAYHYRARYYSPVLGRFLQRDPLGYVDGMNLYEYVMGNPTSGTDPTGTVQVKRDSRSVTREMLSRGIYGWTTIEQATYEITPAVVEMDKTKNCCVVKKSPELAVVIPVWTTRGGAQDWTEDAHFDGTIYRQTRVVVSSALARFSERHESARFTVWKTALTGYFTDEYEKPATTYTAPTCDELMQKLNALWQKAKTGFERSKEFTAALKEQVGIGQEKANVRKQTRKSWTGNVVVEYILE